MRVLAVRPGNVEQDMAAGRATLDAALENPSTTVMIIRRDDPEVAGFADLAAGRSDPFPWRDSVWVMDERIFRTADANRWFAGRPSACAVVLNMKDEPVVWLDPDAQIFDIDDAFLTAERSLSTELGR
jgi:hypothetical protein